MESYHVHASSADDGLFHPFTYRLPCKYVGTLLISSLCFSHHIAQSGPEARILLLPRFNTQGLQLYAWISRPTFLLVISTNNEMKEFTFLYHNCFIEQGTITSGEGISVCISSFIYVHRGREVMVYYRKRCVSCAWDGSTSTQSPPILSCPQPPQVSNPRFCPYKSRVKSDALEFINVF